MCWRYPLGLPHLYGKGIIANGLHWEAETWKKTHEVIRMRSLWGYYMKSGILVTERSFTKIQIGFHADLRRQVPITTQTYIPPV